MFSAFLNCLKIRDLRERIVLTIVLIFAARLGAHIPLPGLDPGPLQEYFKSAARSGGGALAMVNLFTGGGLLRGTILALGIMPYINASIFMQVFSAVEPHLARLAQEGDVGRQKISQYTRYATIVIAGIQALMILYALAYHPEQLLPDYTIAKYGPIVIMNPAEFMICGALFLTAGSLLLMWIGEQITQFGIGNGVSLLITVNIVAGLPAAVRMTWNELNPPIGVAGINTGEFLAMLFLLAIVVAGVVALTQAQRKIPVQYAKRVVGRRVFQSQSSYMPLKVNYAGVMPIIFASAILMFPQQIFSYLHLWFNISMFQDISSALARGTPVFYTLYTLLIFGFSFFWVSLMFKPIQVADDLKKYGGYVPGVPPGEPTAKFLDYTMTRITLAGALFLTIIAVVPNMLMDIKHVPYQIAQFFGGTSMLIVVGVLLDTMRQVETFLLQRHYDGFLKKGRAKSNVTRAAQTLDRQEIRNLRPLWMPFLILFVVGLIAWHFNP